MHQEHGASNINLPEAQAERAMIDASHRCVVLANGSKLGVWALAPVCSLDDVDVIVTDRVHRRTNWRYSGHAASMSSSHDDDIVQ